MKTARQKRAVNPRMRSLGEFCGVILTPHGKAATSERRA